MPKSKSNKSKRNKKPAKSKKPSFVKTVVKFLLSTILVLILIYFFVLPSVIISGIETQNILIVSDILDEQNNYVSLAHLSKNTDENVIVLFNGDQAINNVENYGNYNLRAIYQLLKIDRQSDQKIKSVFSNILKISIDEVVVVNGVREENLENIFIQNLTNNLDSSIKNKLYLLKLHFVADSMEIFKFSDVASIKKTYYKLSTLEEKTYKNCSVSVVNTTDTNGLAQRVSEIIENTGAQVMQVESSESRIKTTVIYYPEDKPECKQLTDRISGLFPAEIILKSRKNLPTDQQLRSSVVVMLGLDRKNILE